jgi:hypothetical protein
MKHLIAMLFLFAASAPAEITLEIKDYVALPITGLVDGKTNYDGLLARVSGMREEPGGANRFFVPDLNGPLYIVDKDTKKLTAYLDFNGREGKPGIFHKLFLEAGYGSGLNTLYFDLTIAGMASSTPSTSKIPRWRVRTCPTSRISAA